MSSPSVIALAEPAAESGGTPAPTAPGEAETTGAPQPGSEPQLASGKKRRARISTRERKHQRRHRRKAHAKQTHRANKQLRRRKKQVHRHDRQADRHERHTHQNQNHTLGHQEVRLRAHALPPVRLSRAAVERTGGTPPTTTANRRRHHRRTPYVTLSATPAFAYQASIVSTDPDDWTSGGETLMGSTPVILPPGLSAQLTQPPAFLLPMYKQAGRRYHVPWRVLAAINSIETDYGHDLSVSSAGALGWMQFMPDTWQLYGQGGNPYDPHDAIFAAARLLDAAGASHDLRKAIFAYNHAGWYVAAVLWRASTISTNRARAADTHDGYALPLDALYMHTLGRTDDGVDIETAPDGAAVYSMTRGVVVTVASDPGGFGPNYPVVLSTSGPLAGHFIYYGHVAASIVRPGEQVLAGQPIAIVGHTGDASGLGHGHIEIGFCDASGDPLSHHGTMAWTPSGQVMRSVLQSLSAKFGLAN